MRIVLHDYAGHAFLVQLSRRLAERGHTVLYQYCASVPGPKGGLAKRADDSPNLTISGIELSKRVVKKRFFEFMALSREHGRKAANEISAFGADVVMLANVPLEVVDEIQTACWREGVPVVFSVQDLVGIAFQKIAGPKLPVLGPLLARAYNAYEHKLLRRSNQVIVISDDFRPFVPVDAYKVTTIENWGVLDEIPQRPRCTEWSRSHGLDKTTNIVYSGTIGMKHNPGLLLRLARDFKDRPDVRVVVCSEGDGANWLRAQGEAEGLTNLLVMPFQPIGNLPDVVGCASLLVAILEPGAGVFSVPSKVLSYLCAGRPILLGIPPVNLAARMVTRVGAGVAVDPTDEEGFSAAAVALLGDAAQAEVMGKKGRAFAEEAFNLDHVAAAHEAVFARVAR